MYRVAKIFESNIGCFRKYDVKDQEENFCLVP